MKIAVELGIRVRKYRKAKGYTQEELSERCSLHPTYIGQIERGEKNPSIESIYKICRALELQISVLFEKIDDIASPEEDSIPLRVFDLVDKQAEQDQKALLAIVQNAVSLVK